VTTVCYIDAAIRDNAGHHANACRHFVSEFRRRGMAVHTFGNRGLDPQVAQELQVERLFRHYPYSRLRGGAQFSHFVERSSFLADLKRVWSCGPSDIVFFHTVMAPQLGAVALWLRELEPAKMPFVVVGFDLPSGSKLNDQWSYHTPFYRKAGALFPHEYLRRVLLFAFDEAIADDYAQLLNLPVQTMPTIHTGLREPRLRARDADGRVNVAFLGHQREEKGYHLIPTIARRLMDRGLPVKLLVHNSAPDDGPTSRELRALARTNAHVVFSEEPGDQSHWQDLLDKSDLVVLPYEPNRYRESGSGIATEAVSDGIPMVVPPGTTMETLAAKYQGCAMAFSKWDADDVAAAIERAVMNFDALARQAEAGALTWRRNNGVGLFVDRLLAAASFDSRLSQSMRPSWSLREMLADRILDGLVSCLAR
jgi:hypothetical protein